MQQLESRDYLWSPAFDAIGLPAEQANYPFRGDGLNIAVIDSGADLSQPYIKGAVNLIDPSASPADGYGHGSFVESEIHAVAPGAGIYSLKVLDDHGSGNTDTGEEAFAWVIQHYLSCGIVAVNYSIEYVGDDPVIDGDIAALTRDGVTVCIAAGNLQATYPNTLNSAADSPDAISVGATWVNYYVDYTFDGATDYQTYVDKIAAYSQRSDKLAMLAPGDVQVGDSGWTGTSMASPLVAGAAVLVHQALASQGKPTDEAAILSVLQSAGKPIFDSPTPQDNVQHTGLTFPRLDIEAAIASIVPKQPQPPAPHPPAQPTNATYVASLYEHVLSRAPDAEGLAYWLGLLGSGDSRADVADKIWQSPEHRQHQTPETPEQLYESLLGRHGDGGGLAYFASKPEDFTAETMLASPEFYGRSLDN